MIAEQYGLEQPTADVDVLYLTNGTAPDQLVRLAGKSSELHKRHRVYLDVVTVAAVPENYEPRNADRDREDLKRLALGPGLDVEVCQFWVEIVQEAQAERAVAGRPSRVLRKKRR